MKGVIKIMEKSKVYFCDLRTRAGYGLLEKLNNLITKAGMKEIDFDEKLTAIKIHFGEYGNLAFIKPNYVKGVVDLIKESGGKPFLTDASTLYVGTRSDAVGHIHTAELNGFNSVTTGCNVVIADGLKGNDYTAIPVNLKHCSNVKIGNAITEADVIISMNHFKGHEMTGFGGVLKNLGMGCGSKLGKLEMHASSKPKYDNSKCIGCGKCKKNCNQDAIYFEDKKAYIDYEKCVGCGQCIVNCEYDVITPVPGNPSVTLNEKITEYAYGVLEGKPSFHISFIMNVSPNCDCWSSNDYPIVPDIGIAASFDPVALDNACAHLVNQAPPLVNSKLSDVIEKNKCDCEHDDKFKLVHPNTDWMSGLTYASELGLGNLDYELIRLD